MYPSPDQHVLERQQYLLDGLASEYQNLAKRYPQPDKFVYQNTLIAQTFDMDVKLLLIQDLTRELTQMTTQRLLNFFDIIPEFKLLTKQEKTAVLIKNMLAVFMFHGALTYDADTDTFVDRTTGYFERNSSMIRTRCYSRFLDDQPYDAKYLLYVYGQSVYRNFIALARQLTPVTYQSPNEKQGDDHSHTLFLLLIIILLFSSDFQSPSIAEHQINSLKLKDKLNKIQQNYVDIATRFIHDRFGFTIGRRMFQKLVPLLLGMDDNDEQALFDMHPFDTMKVDRT
jgi:hypothetical protein